jgi:hypothetical protein
MPTISENLQTEISFRVGSASTPLLGKMMKEAFELPCEATRMGIDDNQDSRSVLGQSKRHTSHSKSQ